MFGKKSETNYRYFEGLNTGEAKAYARIKEILEQHPAQEDAYAILMTIRIICEYELRDNPFVREVTLFKGQPKEL